MKAYACTISMNSGMLLYQPGNGTYLAKQTTVV
jgi:hypothetical protein